ncbi:MAG: hypothetical protein VYA80_03645 [Pseudomonadota bacterium]|nr:hypothetical protein [Pseudomonadota bacterium]
MRFLTVIIFFLAPAISYAAPWCLIKDEKSFCTYYSAETCYDSVARQGGDCRENYREVGVTTGKAPYCIITAKYRDCSFRSRSSCVRKALSVEGGCVRNIERDLERAAIRRRRIESSASDCPDLACELNVASEAASALDSSDQVVIEFDDE